MISTQYVNMKKYGTELISVETANLIFNETEEARLTVFDFWKVDDISADFMLQLNALFSTRSGRFRYWRPATEIRKTISDIIQKKCLQG